MSWERRFVMRVTLNEIFESDLLEKLKGLNRDLSENPIMILSVRGFFKEEDWVDYIAGNIETKDMVRDFKERLENHFKVIDVLKVGPFDLVAFVDFRNGTPGEKELERMIENLEEDVISFLLSPKYLGRIKEQVDLFSDPFKDFVDFAIGHAFVRKADKDGITTAVSVALNEADVRKKKRLSELSSELIRILDRQDLESYFQPIVDVKNKNVIAYEALVRGPKGSKLRRPDLLFKVAAWNGLEMELDKLTRRKHLENFKKSGFKDVFLTVNLGPFAPMFIDEVDRDMKRLGIPPEKVIWEISERTYIDDFMAFLKVIEFLVGRGYRVAVDDFGAGPTTFKLTFSIDSNFIKVDKDIVKNVHEREDRQILLYKLIQCFYRPDNVLVTEGVEKLEEFRTLVKLGYRFFQGFFFFKPSPRIVEPEEVKAKLETIELPSKIIFRSYYDMDPKFV